MINLFQKLKSEDLLKQKGSLLDLGCGYGRVSKPFLDYGYTTLLVDKDEKVLEEADGTFKTKSLVEDFKWDKTFDGIIISNVLPFLKKDDAKEVIKNAWNYLNKTGFLYLTLFGEHDPWAKERADKMHFYNKDEAIKVISDEPYFFSEDYGKALKMDGSIKTWHIFHLLYIK